MLVLRDGSLNEPGFSSGPLGKRGRGLLWPSYIFTSEDDRVLVAWFRLSAFKS